MDINFLDIQITDTQENSLDLSFENASINSIKLIYNGQDDKFANILTSELQFSFLVKDGSDAKFFHLFTGSETRYKVELIDVSVVNYPKTIWTGFILPEQFSEPYSSGPFFVDFVATDRLALLKNKDYVGFSKVSVLQVLNSCLVKTGLVFPVYFSEAIQNAGFNIDYLDLEIDTDSYKEDEEAISYFEVLEKALKSIGCVLFLFENKWYVIGLNKLKEKTLSIKKYSSDGFFNMYLDGVENYTRNVLNSKFVATPTVNVISPLQKVTTTWEHDFAENLIPADAVTHMPVNIESNIDDRTPKYWNVTTDKSLLLYVWLVLLDPNFDYTSIDFNAYYNGFKAVQNPSVEDANLGPSLFINTVNSGVIAIADLDTNYISLEDSFFVNGSSDLDRFASLKIEFFIQKNLNKSTEEVQDYFAISGEITVVENNGSGKARITSAGHNLTTADVVGISGTTVYDGASLVTVVDGNRFDIDLDFVNTRIGEFKILPFAKNFFFAITKKEYKTSTVEEIVFSNFTTAGIPENRYGFNVSYSNLEIKGILDLEKVLLDEDGWYNIRLYPHVTNDFLGDLLVYKTCDFTLKEVDKFKVIKSRDIDYTTALDLDLFHSSSALNLSKKAFTFSSAFTQSVLAGDVVPGELTVTPISYSTKDNYYYGSLLNTEITVVLNGNDYRKIEGGYAVYVIRAGGTALTEITEDTYYLEETSTGAYLLKQLVFPFSTFEEIRETDTIYIKAEDFGISLRYAEYWLDRWRRYDVDEDVPMYEAIAKMYHDLLHEYNFVVTGTYLGLVSPLELISFVFKGERTFYPTNLQLDLHANTTELTMIESKNENVTDYE